MPIVSRTMHHTSPSMRCSCGGVSCTWRWCPIGCAIVVVCVCWCWVGLMHYQIAVCFLFMSSILSYLTHSPMPISLTYLPTYSALLSISSCLIHSSTPNPPDALATTPSTSVHPLYPWFTLTTSPTYIQLDPFIIYLHTSYLTLTVVHWPMLT